VGQPLHSAAASQQSDPTSRRDERLQPAYRVALHERLFPTAFAKLATLPQSRRYPS